MASFNRVILVGYLTRDPDVKYTSSGMAIASFGLAINRKVKDKDKKDEVDFFDIDAWDKLAELCSKYLHKGNPVLIDGRLKQDRWEDEQGNKRSKIKVVATGIQFLGKKDDSDPWKPDGDGNNEQPPF